VVLCATAAQAQSAFTVPASALVQPAALHHELEASPHGSLVLQVGSRMLFDEDHIPGAVYAGPASTPEGIEALRARVTPLARSRAIVLYCGCCPWDHCPNIAPAWSLLRGMGFTHVRVLFIAHNFGTDWVSKGYGVERSQ
jgi:3-mercaptopyruvate sulfurtransferase SseA